MSEDILVEKSLYDKIVEKGLAEADIILKNGNEKATEVKEDIIVAAKKEAKDIIASAKNKVDTIINTKKIEFDQAARHNVLTAKKAAVDDSVLSVITTLKQLPDDKFKELVLKLIKTETLTGTEVIYVAADEMKRYIKLFSDGKAESGLYKLSGLNKELGSGFNLKLNSKPANIKGGFLVIGVQYDVNLSYEAVLHKIKESYEPEIAKIIFQTEG